MVMWRPSSRASRSKERVELRRVSAKGIWTWRPTPQFWPSTRGTGKTMTVARRPMGTDR
jgi:hypothetical protein